MPKTRKAPIFDNSPMKYDIFSPWTFLRAYFNYKIFNGI